MAVLSLAAPASYAGGLDVATAGRGECGLARAAYPGRTETVREERTLEKTVKLERFLAEVERRAFRIARFAMKDTEDALDIVQDSMISLASRYCDRPEDEWPALFHRILQNRIRDYQRRRTVRNRVMAWLPARAGGADEPVPDPVESAPDLSTIADPAEGLALSDATSALEEAVAGLPRRQQQAFLLRAWEGLDVAETASAMGCSQGSVKTHYSRAVHALRDKLGEHWT